MSVYVIEMRGAKKIKIGYSVDTAKRMAELQTGCPERLELVYELKGADRRFEVALHKIHADQRCAGEWFEYRGSVKRMVDAIRAHGHFGLQKFIKDARYESPLAGDIALTEARIHIPAKPARSTPFRRPVTCVDEDTKPLGCNIAAHIRRRRGVWKADELADLLGMSRKHILMLALKRRMPSYRIGGSVRFDPTATAEWLEKRSIS